MRNYNFLFIILLGITLTNCGGTKKGENTLFTFDDSKFTAQYQPQGTIKLGILNPNEKSVDSVVYFINDTKIGSKKGIEFLARVFTSLLRGTKRAKCPFCLPWYTMLPGILETYERL